VVMAVLLSPHRRSLKTIGGMVAGHRCHGGTISRRLDNPLWRTLEWYTTVFENTLSALDRWERRRVKGPLRRWFVVIDTTYHTSVAERMENMITMARRQHPARRTKRQHAFVMGMLLTESGARLPLPRKSYYTREYCEKHGQHYMTQPQLAAAMIRALRVPEDVLVTVLVDSAFDTKDVHRACREQHFHEVFPLDPNRVLEGNEAQDAAGIGGQRVVQWTRQWLPQEFAILELQVENEAHGLVRRRHVDNLRVKKTERRYAVAARRAVVSNLGECLIVASYKENLKIALLPGQSADWIDCHHAPICYRKQQAHQPARWHGKVLASTDTTATPRQVVEWYELRWQVELFFRELKSRLQLEGYVFQKFTSVERYLDLLLMGFLFLEWQRLQELQRDGPQYGAAWVHARTTDRLRMLERLCLEANVQYLAKRLRTPAGCKRVLRELLRQAPCQVA